MRKNKAANPGLRVLITLVLSMLLVFAVGFQVSHRAAASETEKPAPVPEKKTITKETVKMIQFNTKQLKAGTPAAGTQIQWSSSNINVCVVSPSGLVQAVNGGSCTITAVNQNTTYKWPVKVTPLQLNKTSMTLIRRRPGETLSLNNKNAKNATSWSSSHTSVATVNSSGYVTPHAAGSAVISAKWNGVTLTCTVQVKDATVDTLRSFRNPKSSSNQKKVILAGASLLDHWTSAYSAFGSTTIINNAIPDSFFANWNSWYKKLITQYNPKVVVLCLGTDDIGAGPFITGEQAAEKMQKLIEKIHKKCKKTKIFYVSLPLYPMNPTAWDATNTYNSLMKDYCSKKKFMTYLNLTTPLLAGSEPIEIYFKAPNTYLSPEGYNVVNSVVVKKVKKAAK
jgi:lysophospholipase L1-like esterase